MDEISMKAVLRQTGLSADRLRVWEKRYGAVRPSRSESGRRVYRESEVKRLKLLATLVNQGHLIGSIARLPDVELVKLVTTTSAAPVNDNRSHELSHLIEALERFDLSRIRTQLGLLRFSSSPRDFAFRIVPQVMFLVGMKFEEGRISIAQEHALSEILQIHLRRIYEDLEAQDGARANEGPFLFCTREGDPHDFGLLMAVIACRAAGLETHYVGRSLPSQALAEATKRLKPRAVILGMSLLPKEDEKVTPQAYLDDIHQQLPESVEFWIGGSAVSTLRRPKSSRTVFLFESVEDLENKIRILAAAPVVLKGKSA